MKNSESQNLLNKPYFDNKVEYYKSIGEKAALYAFKKPSLSQKKLESLSPPNKLIPKTDARHIENDMFSFLSPISRDVSHLRDKLLIPASSKINDLPSDIKQVKKVLIANKPLFKGLPSVSNIKEYSLDNASKQEIPAIDRLLLGPPSGRQECNILKKWFETMKETYCSEEGAEAENISLIYSLCAKELVRQVSVQCFERGELLQEVLTFLIKTHEKNSEKIETIQVNTSRVKKALKEDFEHKELVLSTQISELQMQNTALVQRVEKNKQKMRRLKRDLKEKIEEIKGKQTTEEDTSLKPFRILRKGSRAETSFKTLDSIRSRADAQVQTIWNPLNARAEEHSISPKIKSKFSDKLFDELDSLQEDENESIIENESEHINTGLINSSQYKIKIIEIHDNDSFEHEKTSEIPKYLLIQEPSTKQNSENSTQTLIELSISQTSLHIPPSIRLQPAINTTNSLPLSEVNDFHCKAVAPIQPSIPELLPLVLPNPPPENLHLVRETLGSPKIKSVVILDTKPQTARQAKRPFKKSSTSNPLNKLKDLEILIAQKLEQSEQLDNKIQSKINELQSLSRFIESKHKKIETLANPHATSKEYSVDHTNSESDSENKSKIVNEANEIVKYSSEGFNIGQFSEEIKRSVKKSVTEICSPSSLLSQNKAGDRKFFRFPENIEEESRNTPERGVSKANNLDDSSFEEFLNNSNDERAKDVGKNHRKATKKQTVTEFAEFQFHQRTHIRENTRKNPAKRILAKITMKKSTWIRKRATMTKKMVHKMISAIYQTYSMKCELQEPLIDCVFEEISKRYGVQTVAIKKFIEFICSLTYFEGFLHCQMFLRFIGSGALINQSSYSQDSLAFYLSTLSLILSSKAAISLSEDSLERLYLPIARAIELSRERLSSIDKALFTKSSMLIEKSSTKKYNNSFLIETEVLLEILTNVFEENHNEAVNSVVAVINAVKYKENKEIIEAEEVRMIVKVLCPIRLEECEVLCAEKVEVDAAGFLRFCVEKGGFNIDDIINPVLQEDKTKLKEDLKTLINALKVDCGKESGKFLKKKLDNLSEGLNEREPLESYLAYFIYSSAMNI